MKRIIIFIFTSLALFIISLQLDSFTYEFREKAMDNLGQFFSILGNGYTLTGICIILFILGTISKKGYIRDSGMHGVFAIITSGFFVHLFKIAFERPRPSFSDTGLLFLLENPLIFDFTGRFNSFPSGHTTASFALAYALSRSYPWLSPLFYTLAAGVGISRVFLGSHYPSDVVGGAILGVAVSMFLFSKARKYWKTGLFFSFVIFISFFKLGGLLLFDVDEAVFSEASREMLETGNYITPTYNYEPRYDKPILFYWLMAMGFKLFGISEFSARFISAAFGAALVIMTFFFIKRLYGQRQGILAGLCLLFNIEFFLYSHSAVTDMMLTFFITASLYSFYLGYRNSLEFGPPEADRSLELKIPYTTSSIYYRNVWYLLFWASAALATLTKGVIGFLFPAAISVVYLVAERRFGEIRQLFAPRYFLIFFIIASPWYILQLLINGWEFFNAFIIKHHFQRYTEVISSHSGPFYFYLPVIFVGFFPWAAFLPCVLYKGFKEKGIYLFGTLWFLVIFIFFSLAGTKLPNYILPAFPAMAMMTGLIINELLEKRLSRALLYISCVFLIIVSLVMAIIFFFQPTVRIPAEIAFTPLLFLGIGICFLAMAIVGFVTMMGKQKSLAIGGMVSVVSVLLIVLRVYGASPLNSYLQKTLYQYAAYARKNLEPQGVLATYEINQPSIAFYSRRTILKLEGDKGLKELEGMINSHAILVITRNQNIKKLQENARLILLETDGRYALLTNRKSQYLNRSFISFP